MITVEFAQAFAKQWIDAWNSHDLERILNHYAEDFTIETPMAIKFFPQSRGVVKGKEAVKAYWSIGLERIPDLKFEILDIFIGVDSLSIYYINIATNKKTVEVMSFNEKQQVNKAIVNYAIANA